MLATLEAAGHEPIDLGTWSTDPVDYPDTARAAADAVRDGPRRARRRGLRLGRGRRRRRAASSRASAPARAHDTYTAHQAVEHDDVNVLCLGARVVGPAYAAEIIAAFAGAPSSPARSATSAGWRKIEAIEREFTAER